jgi:hypothetical protein
MTIAQKFGIGEYDKYQNGFRLKLGEYSYYRSFLFLVVR